MPAGTITEGDSTFAVQTGVVLGSVDDIAALPVLGATEQQPADARRHSDERLSAPRRQAGPPPRHEVPATSVPVATTIADVASVELTDNPVRASRA